MQVVCWKHPTKDSTPRHYTHQNKHDYKLSEITHKITSLTTQQKQNRHLKGTNKQTMAAQTKHTQ